MVRWTWIQLSYLIHTRDNDDGDDLVLSPSPIFLTTRQRLPTLAQRQRLVHTKRKVSKKTPLKEFSFLLPT